MRLAGQVKAGLFAKSEKTQTPVKLFLANLLPNLGHPYIAGLNQNIPNRQIAVPVISVFVDSAKAPAAIIAVLAEYLLIGVDRAAIYAIAATIGFIILPGSNWSVTERLRKLLGSLD